ncbi:MAG: CPBP family intramembrane glutamic endopeptidase [Candidatus Kapaibacterium sp.]
MMKRAFLAIDPRPYWTQLSPRSSVLLLLAAVLPALHHTFGSIAFAETAMGLPRHDAVLYMFAAAALLFGVVPALVLRMFGARMSDFGVGPGDWRTGLTAVTVLFPLVLVFTLLPGAYTPELQNFYPFDRDALQSWGSLAQLELSRAVVYYYAWEFFFRGVLLFGLRKELGDWTAICIQVIPSCLWHLGMPASEIFSSILAGFGFAILALRTGSFLWPYVIHVLIGVGMDSLIKLVVDSQ